MGAPVQDDATVVDETSAEEQEPGRGRAIGDALRDSLRRPSLEGDEVRTAVVVGLGTLAFTTFTFVLYPAAFSILLLGAILGTLSALVAVGLVLVYRANRVINFAQGDIGGMAGVLAGSLIVGPGLPFFVAVGIAFAFVLVLGALTEILVIRRFASAPRLVLTVATIGLAQLFQVGQLVLPQLFDYDTAPQPPRPFDFTFEIDPVVFGPGHLMIVVAVPLIAVGLGTFLRRSRSGIAIRAAAESTQRAALLGIPVKRLNTMVWVLAAALSGAGVLLRLPIQGVSIGAVLGPALLLRALAAAVIGRMESLPRTFAAAMGIGVLEAAVLNITGRTVVVDAVLFGVILVVLLVQKGGLGERAKDSGVASWAASKEFRPIPAELRRLPEVRSVLYGLGGLGVVGLLVWPLTLSIKDANLLSVGVIFSMVIVSLVVLTGWSGQITLGHLANVAIGSAVAGVLAQQGRHLFVCLAAAMLVGVGVSLLLGIPAIRIPGLFYAVTSLAFAIACGTYFLNPEFFPWLVPDPVSPVTRLRPVLLDKFDLESEYSYYYFCLFFLVFTIAAVSRLRRSRTGRVLVANRENTRAVQSYGVSRVKAELTAFGVAGGIAGLAGGLFFFHQHALSRSILAPNENFVLFSIAVVGGLASIPGALLGSIYLTLVKFSGLTSSASVQLFASGAGVLLVLLVLPNGLGGLLYATRDRLLRQVARRRDLVVPSLLADVRVDDDPTPTAERRPARTSTPSAQPKLLVRGLEVSYGKTQILFGVDFHVEPGEVVALLGTNGAGKSTLLNAITGLVQPQAGTVELEGKDRTGASPATMVQDGLVLMPGGKGVFPTLTVEENLRLAGWIHDDDPEWVSDTTARVYELFPRLLERRDQRAGNLSGGEQQMLTLGQALILRPDVLCIDELSLGLAPVIVEQLLGIVREIHANGTTIVVVEQSVNVAITLADRAVFMEKGEVRFDGPTAELLERPEILRAVFLQGAGAKDALDAPEDDADLTEDVEGELLAGAMARPAASVVAPDDVRRGPDEELLRLEDVAVSFGGVQAVRGVSFDVRRRQILGVIGPNGAGKTTVFDLVSGFVTPDRGRIFLAGTDVTDVSPSGRALLGLGRSFQDARLFSSMTVRETVATALERRVPVRDAIASIVLSPAVKLSERQVATQAAELIDLMNLGAFADKFVGELSTGSRRIVDLACCLAHRPEVLLLDEPSSGIAQRESEALGPVLESIRDQLDCAVVLIEHDMPLITGVSDELLALELGSVVLRGDPQTVVTDPRVVEGYLGGDAAVINRSGSDTTAGAAATPEVTA